MEGISALLTEASVPPALERPRSLNIGSASTARPANRDRLPPKLPSTPVLPIRLRFPFPGLMAVVGMSDFAKLPLDA